MVFLAISFKFVGHAYEKAGEQSNMFYILFREM